MQPVDSESSSFLPRESIRNIAILLHALPERTHRTLLGQLSADDKQHVLGEMACLKDVDASEQHRVLSALREQLQAETVDVDQVESEIRDEIVIGRPRLSKKPTSSSRPPEPVVVKTVPRGFDTSAEPYYVSLGHDYASATPVVAHAEPPDALDEHRAFADFGFVNEFGVENVGRVLQRETAETIAWVLTAVDALTGSALLQHLDETKRSEALSHCATMNQVDPTVLEMVAKHLRHQLEAASQSGTQITAKSYQRYQLRRDRGLATGRESSAEFDAPPQGPDSANRNDPAPTHCDAEAERRAESVDRVLMALAPKDLCRALGMVTTEQAFLVLCGLPNETAEQALALLPRRMARKVRADMRQLGQLQLSDIDAAKLVVAEVALRMTVAPQRMVA